MSLDELAVLTGTDKSSNHLGYTKYYEDHFESIKDKKLNILELGVASGASIKLWDMYFKNANIVGIDIEYSILSDIELSNRCSIEIGSQDDEEFLKNLTYKHGEFDIIIDDASHLASKTIKSFELLFPLLKSGGIYVIEDLGIFYPASEKGNYFKDLEGDYTTIDFLKDLLDMKNNDWFLKFNKKETNIYYDMIYSISFYPCICFIHKN